MSKKSKREAMLKEQAAKERAEMRKPSVQAKKKPANSAKGAVRSYPRPDRAVARKFDPTRVMYVRITAAVIAVLALAGGIYWGYMSRGAYTALTIIGLVLLGFLAGFGLLVAVRTEDILKRAPIAPRR